MRQQLVFAITLLMIFAGCNSTPEEFCKSPELDGFEADLESGVLALAPWNPETEIAQWVPPKEFAPEANRAIASEKESRHSLPATTTSLPAADREDWFNWSTARLNQVQGYIDLTYHREDYREVRKHLTQVANRLSTLHGFAEKGDVVRMVSSLKAIREESRLARKFACESTKQGS